MFRLFCLVTFLGLSSGALLGSYFPNWSQYRKAPFKFVASDVSGAASSVDIVNYAFGFFCPESSWVQPYWITQLHLCQGKQPFELTHPEANDPASYQTLVAMKSSNPNLKVVLSVGGWTFPSHFFSGMVSSAANRATFIKSCQSWMSQYGFDGIDIDWEHPCSKPRTDEVKIACWKFDAVTDNGGASCEVDGPNYVALVREMRAAFGNSKIISIAGRGVILNSGLQALNLSEHINYFNVMTYDFTVSDIADSPLTAPNSPLYSPSEAGVSKWSIDMGIKQYLKAGVQPSKLLVGIAYYGHTWYVPGQSGTGWQKYGLTAQKQGQCCSMFAQTYGAKYGKYSGQCGLYMYPEVKAAKFDTYFDNVTQSNIGYTTNAGADGYTAQGVWISYNDVDSLRSITQYVKKMGLGGAFIFDLSMDTNVGNGPTFELTKFIRENV